MLEVTSLTRFRTRASRSNSDYVAAVSRTEGSPDPKRLEFLWDPQTSGGLLISIAPGYVDVLLKELHTRGATRACVIGDVLPQADVALIFRG